MALFLTLSLGAGLSHGEQEIQEVQEEFNCYDMSLWDERTKAQTKGQDILKCNQTWALKNVNEVNAMTQVYVTELESKIKAAERNNDTKVLDDFQSRKLCKPGSSLAECSAEISRRVVSHTIQIRQNTLQSNRLINELRSPYQQKMTSEKQEKPQNVSQNIEALRKEKSKKISPCEENPFRPCAVKFGKYEKDKKTGKGKAPESLDKASEKLVTAKYEILKSEATFNDKGERVSAANVRNEEDKKFKKAIEARISDNNPDNPYSREAYASDIMARKAVIEAEAAQEDFKPKLEMPAGADWEALNTSLDKILAQKKQAGKSSKGGEDLYVAIEEQKDATFLSTDGEIKEHLGL